MICNRCGKNLPSEGTICKFCGAMMSPEQIDYQNKTRDRDAQRIQLLSEKYGHKEQIDYREEKENKVLGLAIILIVIVFLIVLAILLNR